MQLSFDMFTCIFSVSTIRSFVLPITLTFILTAGRRFKRLIFTHVGLPRFGEKSANFLAAAAQNRFSMGMFHQMFFKIGFKLFGVHCLDLGLNSVGEHPDCLAQQFQRTDLIALGLHSVCVV